MKDPIETSNVLANYATLLADGDLRDAVALVTLSLAAIMAKMVGDQDPTPAIDGSDAAVRDYLRAMGVNGVTGPTMNEVRAKHATKQ